MLEALRLEPCAQQPAALLERLITARSQEEEACLEDSSLASFEGSCLGMQRAQLQPQLVHGVGRLQGAALKDCFHVLHITILLLYIPCRMLWHIQHTISMLLMYVACNIDMKL